LKQAEERGGESGNDRFELGVAGRHRGLGPGLAGVVADVERVRPGAGELLAAVDRHRGEAPRQCGPPVAAAVGRDVEPSLRGEQQVGAVRGERPEDPRRNRG